jgi:sulfate/thiosulfate transport system permease protein
MSAARSSSRAPRRPGFGGVFGGEALQRGMVLMYLSLIVLIPLAAVVWTSSEEGWSGFWSAITAPEGMAALRLTFGAAFIVVVINAVAGTLIAWVLVRDSFWGQGILNSVIDLPFALPTIVAGLTLLVLYGPGSPVGIDIAYAPVAVVVALLFVSLPFVVRAVQPVLEELDTEMEEAAASLGAGRFTIFRRIILPTLMPAILGGSGLTFARSLGEFGAVVLVTGNIAFETQVASVYIFGQVEGGEIPAASAVSVVLLAFSLLALIGLNAVQGRWTRHED